MGCELGRRVAGADAQGYDWGFEIAVGVRKLEPNRTASFFTNSLNERGFGSGLLRFHRGLILRNLFP